MRIRCTFSIVIPFEKTVQVLRIRGTFSLNYSIFYGPNFGPRFWDIFSISGNALMNHFFSIVISFEKAKNGSVRFCGSDAPFHWNSIFYNFWPKFGPRFWDIFWISGNALMNHFFSIVIAKKRKTVLWGFADPMQLKIQFFWNFWPNLGPDFEIFSQFQANALMNHFFSIVISFEKAKNGSGSDAPFHWIFNFLQFLA